MFYQGTVYTQAIDQQIEETPILDVHIRSVCALDLQLNAQISSKPTNAWKSFIIWCTMQIANNKQTITILHHPFHVKCHLNIYPPFILATNLKWTPPYNIKAYTSQTYFIFKAVILKLKINKKIKKKNKCTTRPRQLRKLPWKCCI